MQKNEIRFDGGAPIGTQKNASRMEDNNYDDPIGLDRSLRGDAANVVKNPPASETQVPGGGGLMITQKSTDRCASGWNRLTVPLTHSFRAQ